MKRKDEGGGMKGKLFDLEPTDGAMLIAVERMRQIDEEGWTPEHDDNHTNGEMALAAACYTCEAYAPGHGVTLLGLNGVRHWLWDWKWWKPKDPISNLVRAGALIAAEIDRLLRLEGKHE